MFRPYRPVARLSLDCVNACVHQGDRQLKLTPKAFAVLRHLMERQGRLATKDELMLTVWPDTVVTEASLTTCIREIRRVLRDDAGRPLYIQTVHTRGYRFIGAVVPALATVPASGGPVSVGPASVGDAVPPEREAGSGPSLFGRDGELASLARALRQVERGARRVIFIGGEAGIGKTTLVEHFAADTARAGGPAPWVARGQCVEQYGGCEPYLPWFDVLNHLAREAGTARLAGLLRRCAPMWLAQLPWLIDAEERQQLQREIAGATRDRMMRELGEALDTLSADRPLVVVLEDLHWSDPSSIGMLAHLARRQRPGRLLLIGTYRPTELHVTAHPLMALKQELLLHGACDDLSLDFLTTEAVAAYVRSRLPGAPDDLAVQVHRRTDGNALFVVNVIDHLVARGALVHEDGRWHLRGSVEAVQRDVPESLKELIERLLDRQSYEDRRVLEAASVAGVTFSAASVAAALEDEVESAEERLGALARRGSFVRAAERQVPADGTQADGTQSDAYSFIHAFYQHVLYERIGTTRRSRMHRQIGEHLEAGHRDRTDAIAAELALHFHRGRDAARAVRYLTCAGENAIRRSAYVEAIALLNQGIDQLASLPEGPDRDACELQLRMPLGVAYINARGYAVPEVGSTFQRAYTLCGRMSDTASLFRALRGVWIFAEQRADLRKALTLAEELLTVASREGDPSLLLEGHRIVATTSFHMGDFSTSLDHLRHGLALYDAKGPSLHAFLYGQDPGVCCFVWQSWMQWYLGDSDRAVDSAARGIELARRIGHPYSLSYAHNFAARLYLCLRDPTAVERYAREALRCGDQHGLTAMIAMAQVLHGWSRTFVGHRDAGIAEIEEGIGRWRTTGSRLMIPYWKCLLASALDEAGRTSDALHVLDGALVDAAHTEERWFECELYLEKASLIARIANRHGYRAARAAGMHQAQRALRRAVDAAAAIASPPLRLRAEKASRSMLAQM